MLKKDRGFTLIELLVVIAIIGILSSIVLASLNTARAKGNDAKTKAQLSGLRAAAEVYFDNQGQSYNTGTPSNGMCGVNTNDTSGLYAYLQNASYPGGTTVVCNSTATAYAVQANLNTANTYWCVDSKGTSKQVITALNTSTVCPAS